MMLKMEISTMKRRFEDVKPVVLRKKRFFQSGNRDGSSPKEDNGRLSVTAVLAKDVALIIQSRRFHDCLAILNQLVEKIECDLKIIHNIAITEYFHEGCSYPRKLLEILHKVKKESIDLTRKSGELADSVSNFKPNNKRFHSTTEFGSDEFTYPLF